MLFWLVAIGLVLGATGTILAPLVRRRAIERDSEVSDVDIYKDQLRELEADLGRGVVTQAEAETSRIEISRRLLAASNRAANGTSMSAPSGLSRGIAAALLVIIAGTSIGTYLVLGTPGLEDQPLAARDENRRLPQDRAEDAAAAALALDRPQVAPEIMDLIGRLRTTLETNGDDLTGHTLLVNTLGQIGDYSGAWRAQDDVLRILGDNVAAEDVVAKADLMILAANGYVSSEADLVIKEALRLDPDHPMARLFSGVSLAQGGESQMAMDIWARLSAEAPPASQWKDLIDNNMRRLADVSGVPLPGGQLRGPSQEDVENAAEMSQEDRMEMVRGMVNQLSDRLATDGGPAPEWARLITSLAVLGEADRARAIYTEALATFDGNSDAIAALQAAAAQAGLE